MSKKIFVVGGGGYSNLVEKMAEVESRFSMFFAEPESFSCVFFTGGEDVSPDLYGHRSCKFTYTSRFRDYLEKQIFDLALECKIPMIGVCRGVQWLTVMNKGLMIQHVVNHAMRGWHQVRTYKRTFFGVNSLHHQMVYPAKDTYIMAVSKKKLSNIYLYDGNQQWQAGPVQEIEACFFPRSNAFGVQWHPEMISDAAPARKFFAEHVEMLLAGELKRVLDENFCPTMGELLEDGDWGKYKSRYSRTQVIKAQKANGGTEDETKAAH